jgi:hypothetical protein
MRLLHALLKPSFTEEVLLKVLEDVPYVRGCVGILEGGEKTTQRLRVRSNPDGEGNRP